MKNLLQKSELNRKLRNFITLCFVCLLAIGNAWGQTIEINTTNSGVTGNSYQDATFDVDNITFGFTQWLKSTTIQAKKSITNSLYNVDAIPGKITSITFVQTQTARAIKVYGGTSIKPTTEITAPITAATMTFDFTGENYTYFSMTTPGNACYFSSITISYETQSSGTYTITYNANGATSGNVPTDANEYSDANNQVTVLGNTNYLAKDCHTFAGWNTAADGNGNSYTAGSTFTIENDTTLYAQWTQNTHAITMPDSNQYGTYTSSESDLSSVGCGENVTLIYTPVAGYEQYAATWSVNGTLITGDSFTMPNEDVAVTVSVEEDLTVSSTIDFENESSSYSDWTFTNMTSKETTDINAHGGTYYGTTGGKETASITSVSPIANPNSIVCYVSKQSTNNTTSTWKIQVSTNKSSWTDVNTRSASSMSKGEWVEFSADLSVYSNVYVRVYYDGTSAVRNIDDLTLVYTPDQQVAVEAPVINPESGTVFDGTLEVEITADSDASIYYTDNGDNPTNAPILYNGPFSITETKTIKAVAYDGTNYSDVVSATFTKVNPVAISTITSEGNYLVRGTVVATSKKGFVVGDSTGYVYVYLNRVPTQVVDDKVLVSGAVTVYNGVFEFSGGDVQVSPTTTSNYIGKEPVAITGSEMDARVGSSTGSLSSFVQYTGMLSLSSGHYNITNIEGANTAVGSILYPTNGQVDEFESYVGSPVVVSGYYVGNTSPKYYNIMLNTIAIAPGIPDLTLSTTTMDFNYTVGEGPATQSLTVSGTNLSHSVEVSVPQNSNFEISLSEDGTYGESVQLAVTDSTLAETRVYVQLKAGLPVGNYNETLVVDATDINEQVTLTGSVKPVITASTFHKVTSAEEITTTGTYMLVCPSASTAATSEINNKALQTKSISIENDEIQTAVNDVDYPSTITLEVASNGYYIKLQNENYLKNTDGTDLAVAPNNGSVWVFSSNPAGFIVQNSSNGYRFLGGATNAGATYKAYATSNLGASYPAVVLYKMEETVQEYDITILNEDETVTSNVATAQYGDEVELTITPSEGYITNEILVAYGNNEYADVTAVPNQEGHYTFSMPASDVEVLVDFVFAEWVRVNISDIRGWEDFAIVDTKTSTALSNANDTSSAPSAVHVAISGNNMAMDNNNAATITWHLHGVPSAGYYFATDDAATTWLYSTDDNDGLRVGTGENKRYSLSNGNSYSGLLNIATNRYVGVSTVSSNWQNYTSLNDDITGTSIAFFKHLLNIVYLMPGNGTCVNAYMKETAKNGGVVLPEATPATGCDADWMFIGWSSSPVSMTTEEPTYYKAGETYVPVGNERLYAVYRDLDNYTSYPTCCSMELPYEETFETTSTLIPECWSYNELSVQTPNDYAKVTFSSGNHSLKMMNKGTLVMPMISNTDISSLKMTLSVKQTSSQYRLQVGVMTDPANESSFVAVKTINNSGTGFEQSEVDFSNYAGNGKYIAFRNILAPGFNYTYSGNYIDNIIITSQDAQTCSITELPYTEDFDAVTSVTRAKTGVEPSCWTYAYEYSVYDPTLYPQVYHGTSNSGNYSLYMMNRGIYAMPEIGQGIDINTLKMTLSVKQTAKQYCLEVGVMSNLTDENTFVPVALINNSGTGFEQCEVDFSRYAGTGRYIAFRNTLASGFNYTYSGNYIDDIELTAQTVEPCGISTLPYTEDFDAVTSVTRAKTGVEPSCWTYAHEYFVYDPTLYPQVYHGVSNSGNYSLYMMNRGIYAMPELINGIEANTLKMTLSVKQTAKQYRLEVGVMSDLTDESTFVPVAVINNRTTGFEESEIDFSSYAGQGKYIAFRNVLAPGFNYTYSGNYIDDITLSIATPETRLAENEQVSEEVETVEETEETASYDNEDNFSLLTREPEVTVYPNPTTGNLHFAAMENVEKVEVYNNIGRLMATFNNQREINISDMPAGLYMLRVTLQGDAVVMKKVVKK